MPTPNCWKTKNTDVPLPTVPQEPAAETPRVFVARDDGIGHADGEHASKSSRTFRANALVRREIRSRSSNGCATPSRITRVRRRCIACRVFASHASHAGVLQAAPLLARRRCASHMCASPTRMRCVHERRDRHVARGRRRSAAKKLRERLLTPEKSVIRFRPADIPCGSK